ncbi:hypothetical protein vseg_013952 [Gypsophila vaccaria]
MASTTLFLLFLLLATVNATTETNTAAIPPTLPPSLPPPPPPPPPPPQDPLQEAHFNTIIDAILNAGDFSNWANLISGLDPSSFPISATIFVPDDDSFLRPPPASSTVLLSFIDPLLFPYHIVPRRFVFSELLLFPSGARLPTLLAGKTLVVTNNSAFNFTVDGALVTRPDLYQNGAVAVHGVGGVLDYTLFGSDGGSPPPENDVNADDNDNNNDNDNVDDGGADGNVSLPVTQIGGSGSGGKGVPTMVQVSSGERLSSLWSWLCRF